MNTNPLNLAVRFILEIVMLAVFIMWGWHLYTDSWRYVAAISFPVIAAVLWGVFRIQNDPKPAPVEVPGMVRLLLELALFGLAVKGIFYLGYPMYAYAMAGIVVMHYLVSYDRTWAMLRNKYYDGFVKRDVVVNYNLTFLPIQQEPEGNKHFMDNPICKETLYMTMDFYKRVGFAPPWIGYYVEQDGELVGCAAYKGAPVNGGVEIAYGTFEKHQQKGIGTAICRKLVELSRQTDASVRVTARTLPERNFSTKILGKNNFKFIATVNDPEDGDVWEWEYRGGRN